MPEKSTHVLARVRESDGRDTTELFKLDAPTTFPAEATLQFEESVRQFNADNPGRERILIDLTMLAPGQEKVIGPGPVAPRPPAPVLVNDTSTLAAQRNAAAGSAGAKAAIVGSVDPAAKRPKGRAVAAPAKDAPSGDANAGDGLDGLSVAELKERAKVAGVTGADSMKKADLLAALRVASAVDAAPVAGVAPVDEPQLLLDGSGEQK